MQWLCPVSPWLGTGRASENLEKPLQSWTHCSAKIIEIWWKSSIDIIYLKIDHPCHKSPAATHQLCDLVMINSVTWVNYLIVPCLSFLMCEIGIMMIMVPTRRVLVRVKSVYIQEALRTAPGTEYILHKHKVWSPWVVGKKAFIQDAFKNHHWWHNKHSFQWSIPTFPSHR